LQETELMTMETVTLAMCADTTQSMARKTMDDHGHGTHRAGVIGARANNGFGVAAMNWDVKIVPLKFLSASGSGSLYDAVKAVDYVNALKSKGADIIGTNNSWGGGGYMQPLYDAIARFLRSRNLEDVMLDFYLLQRLATAVRTSIPTLRILQAIP